MENYVRTQNSFFGGMSQMTSNPDRLARLAYPKEDYEANNIFNHQDFRGMLHADHEEALKNSTAASKMKKSQSQRFMTAPTSSKLSIATSHQTELKQNTSTKELFPIPELKTPQNYMLQTLRAGSVASTQKPGATAGSMG